jgi:hypothetical protein
LTSAGVSVPVALLQAATNDKHITVVAIALRKRVIREHRSMFQPLLPRRVEKVLNLER